MSCALGVLWLVLQPSFNATNLAAALILALGVPLVVAPLRPTPATLRHPLRVVRLVLAVGGDVIVSNIAVAAGVLAAGQRPLRPSFVTVPLGSARCQCPRGARGDHHRGPRHRVVRACPGSQRAAPARLRRRRRGGLCRPLQGALRAPAQGDLRMTGFLAGAIAVSLGLYALAMALALWRMLRGPAAPGSRAGARAASSRSTACWRCSCSASATPARCTSSPRS